MVCSACSSSAKVFGSAARMIEAGLIDAAVVGGVDSLCLTTLYGFHSLQLVSRLPCRPFDRARDGISISEAAAFALLERTAGAREGRDCSCSASANPAMPITCRRLIPKGAVRGPRCSRRSSPRALQPDAIDYINLHGTGTLSNDSAESRAVAAVFGNAVPGSSTKGATGHALGAAGALEAVICAIALEEGIMPAGLNTSEVDPALAHSLPADNRNEPSVAGGHEQFLRLRWHQLQSGPGARALASLVP